MTINNKGFPSPCGDKLQWQTLLTNHENFLQKAESCTLQGHYTAFCRKRKGLFGEEGGFFGCVPEEFVRKTASGEGASHWKDRRGSGGIAKTEHKDHLDSAEGASKP